MFAGKKYHSSVVGLGCNLWAHPWWRCHSLKVAPKHSSIFKDNKQNVEDFDQMLGDWKKFIQTKSCSTSCWHVTGHLPSSLILFLGFLSVFWSYQSMLFHKMIRISSFLFCPKDQRSKSAWSVESVTTLSTGKKERHYWMIVSVGRGRGSLALYFLTKMHVTSCGPRYIGSPFQVIWGDCTIVEGRSILNDRNGCDWNRLPEGSEGVFHVNAYFLVKIDFKFRSSGLFEFDFCAKDNIWLICWTGVIQFFIF